jgi:hypothetical protein
VPETQTGSGTLGCLVNTIDGGVFAATNQFLEPSKATAAYTPNSYYSLLITGWRQTTPDVFATITIRSDYLAISQGQTLSLAKDTTGMASASYDVENYSSGDNLYKTIANKPGKLYISHLDQTNNIISGTFSFDAVNAQGDTVHITSGRFDLRY